MKKIIITAFGIDRVGIVAELTNTILSYKGNINDSKMIRLENYFTMMVSITIADSKQSDLVEALQKNNSIEIQTINTYDNIINPESIYQIKLVGENREGYVFMLTNYLKKKKINIETLDTKLINAPSTGTKYFVLNATVHINKKILFDHIKSDLSELSENNNVDINITKNNKTI